MPIHILLLCICLSLPLRAQNGDKKDAAGEKQTERVPREKIPLSPALSPTDALKSIQAQPGFRVELVASEPLVHDPVAMVFDPDGRIWVVEMSGYMRDYEGTGERDPSGSVAVLEDTNGDGQMDKRTVFLDGLTMPRAVSLVRGGVLIAEPPYLWFCQDKNGDLQCDEKTAVANDYGDIKSPEHTANGLIWALDNWIYSADWTFRFKSLPSGEWQREPTAFRGQWGIAQDDFGRLVYNSNSDQFRIDLVPSRYLTRNPNYRRPAGLNIDPIHDQSTYPMRVTPGVNRGYREGTLRPGPAWTLRTFTAACSPLIYRGENFPKEFYGNAFVCEPSANLVKRNLLWEDGAGLKGSQAYTNTEFLASTDERFRPVHLHNGPDGALYVVDMYKGILQHKIFLTTYLRRQSEMRKLEAPLGWGRIYRVVHENKPLEKIALHLSKATSEQLLQQLTNPNGWTRDTAQRLLVERHDATITSDLKKLAGRSENPLGQLHALLVLEGMKQLDPATLFLAMTSEHSKVRAMSIRLSEPFLSSEDAGDFMDRFVQLAETDAHPDVQLQLAFTFGESTDPSAVTGMLSIAKKSSTSPYVRDALLTGLYQKELPFLEKILADPAWFKKADGHAEFLSSLAHALITSFRTNQVERLLALSATVPDWQRTALVDGMGVSASPKRIRFATEPAGLQALQKKDPAAAEKAGKTLTWPGQPGYVPPPVIKPLTADEQTRFETGKNLYVTTCAACHQLTGLGMEGLAPPLADSEWVLNSEQRLARIVLHGVRGPITVKGKTYELDMPGLGATFNDEQIASILTYLRREWEHGADPVQPTTIKAIRKNTTKRAEAWSEAELLQVK